MFNCIAEEDEGKDRMVHSLPTSYESLSADMDHVLENLRAILTNPNFVPIEEVAVREEEIQKLRAGWDKMELKWREAILMMDGWRNRMANGGDSINLDDIKKGLGLGKELNIKDVMLLENDSSDEEDVDDGESDNSITHSLDDLSLAFSAESAPTEPGLGNMMPVKALVEGNGNIRSPRKVTFKAERQVGCGGADENAVAGPLSLHSNNGVKKVGGASLDSRCAVADGLQTAGKQPASSTASEQQQQQRGGERSPKLTVQEKLNVAQAEAEAAAVAAGLELEDITVQARLPGDRDEAARRAMGGGVKKTRVNGRPRRRKSTLTPDELEKLMYS
jgi:hypothetical protein